MLFSDARSAFHVLWFSPFSQEAANAIKPLSSEPPPGKRLCFCAVREWRIASYLLPHDPSLRPGSSTALIYRNFKVISVSVCVFEIFSKFNGIGCAGACVY